MRIAILKKDALYWDYIEVEYNKRFKNQKVGAGNKQPVWLLLYTDYQIHAWKQCSKNGLFLSRGRFLVWLQHKISFFDMKDTKMSINFALSLLRHTCLRHTP